MGRLARGGLANLLGAATTAVVGFAFLLTATRLLSRAEVGAFLAATSVFVVLLTLCKFGSTVGAVYFISRARALGQDDRVKQLLTAATVPPVVVALLAAIGLWVSAATVSELVLDDRYLAEGPLRVLALFLPLAVVTDVGLSATRGFGVVRALVLVDKIGRPLLQYALLVLLVLAASATKEVATWAWAVPYVPSALLALWWLRRCLRRSGPLLPAFAHIGRSLAEFWRYAAPQGVTSVVQVALQRVEILLLAALSGPVQAGVYGAVTRILVLGQMTGQALQFTIQPTMGGLSAQGARTDILRVYQASTAWLILSTWPLYLLMIVFHDRVPLIFGSGYESGGRVVLILCATMLVATGVGMVDIVLTMSGHTGLVLRNTLIALTLNVTLNLVLIPRIGMVGAAVAWAVAILTNNLLPLWQIVRRLHVHPVGRGTAIAVGLVTSSFLGLPLAGRRLLGDSVLVIGVTGGAALLAYCLGVWRFRSELALDELRQVAHRRLPTGSDVRP